VEPPLHRAGFPFSVVVALHFTSNWVERAKLSGPKSRISNKAAARSRNLANDGESCHGLAKLRLIRDRRERGKRHLAPGSVQDVKVS
jgi:hypothetical protein